MAAFLSPEQVQHFEDYGYLVVEGVLPQADQEAVKEEYAARLDQVARRLFAAGQIASFYDDLTFGERYTRILYEFPGVFDFLEITLPLINENMPAGIEMHTGPAVFNMLRHPRLLDVVESILGPEIYSNPVQHLRIKPPASRVPEAMKASSYVSTTTWHQDQGALLDEADQTRMLTVWIAITDATIENGCMVCIPGSHKKGGGTLTPHCPGKKNTSENYIPESLLKMKDVVPMPVPKGGVVLLQQFTEHAALDNQTDSIRWSFDLRYNLTGQPTGRPAFPGFVARSRSNPESELRDPAAWAQNWQEAYERIRSGQQSKPIFNAARWEQYSDAPICA